MIAPGDIAGEMRGALASLWIALEECGATVRDVLKTTACVSGGSRDDLVVAWNEVADAFGDHDPPGALVGVTVPGYPDRLERAVPGVRE